MIPEGQIALGKLAQALIHGAQRRADPRQLRRRARRSCASSASAPGVTVVNSINPFRIEGQKTAAFEIVDVLGDAPDVHCIPVGNAGNITAYWRGYSEYARARPRRPARRACSAGRPRGGAARARRAGAAPRDDRHRDPDRQPGVVGRRDRRPRRVGRPHRRGHRRRDPRRPTACSPPTRAASSSRRRRRRSPGCSQAAADGLRRGRRRRGVHGHRPRAEGPEPGDRRGAGGRGGRRHRRRGRRARWTCRRDHRAGHRRVGRASGARSPTRSRRAATTSCSSRATPRGSTALAAELARRARRRRPRCSPPTCSTDDGLAAVEARLARRRPPGRPAGEQRRLRHVRPLRRARRRRARSRRSELNVVALVRLTHAALGAHGERGAAARSSTSSSLAAYQPTPGERDVRRDEGVRAQLHARRCTRRRRAPACTCMVVCPGLHPHRVPRRAPGSARHRRCPSSCGRRADGRRRRAPRPRHGPRGVRSRARSTRC